MYFGKFDKIQYMGKKAVDITNAILLKYKTMNNSTLWQYYNLGEGETPYMVAWKFYQNASDHWIVLLVNNVVDPFHDWALTIPALRSMCEGKYGEDNIYKIHHIVNNSTGKWVDQVTENLYLNAEREVVVTLPVHLTPISNIEHETKLNDARRSIRVLSPDHLQDFKNQFEDLMRKDS